MSFGDLASEATQVAEVSIGSMEADQYKYVMLSEAGLALVFDYSVDDDIIRAIDLESGAQRWKQTDYRWTLEKYQAAAERARQLAEGDDTLFVHAYDDPDIVAGQGTLGVELYEQVPDVDTVIVPIGGGGLIGGVSTALAGVAPDVHVVGVQAAGAATVPQSLDKGVPVPIDAPDTIADGIATGSISELTLDLIEQHVDEVVLVDDGEIARAILLLLERAKQLVEGAGAAPGAALLSDTLDVTGDTVVPLLCGGNIDPARLQEVLDHAMTDRVQLLQLRVRIEDQPGTMADISQRIAGQGANIREVRGETGRQPAPSVVSVPVPKCDGLSDRRRRCTRGVSVRSVSPATGCRSGSPRLRESAWFGCCYTEKRCSQANPWNKIARSMHHSLQDPQDQVVGFVLDADRLGHEIYRILDWADEHFRSYSVDQADGRVYVRSDAIEDEAALHTEPLSVDGHAPASDSSRNGEGDGGRAEPIGM
jgi:cysteine synthase